MQAYILRRLILIIPTLVFVTLILFFVVRLIPGDVVEMMVTEHEQFTHSKGQELLQEIRHKLGLDLPIHVQYGKWVWQVFQGDLGKSLWSGIRVTEVLVQRWPVSFELGILAMITGLIIAIPVGIFSAVRQDSIGDYVARSAAIAGIALPSFWIGTMVMVFPSLWWGWSPRMEYVRFTENPAQNLGQFIIPAAILGLQLAGTTMRMTRTMMLEVLRQDYIRTAWSKGMKERAVVLRHALKNALIPIVTIIGFQFPMLIGGSVVLEEIFNLPGVGRLIVQIINTRDYIMLSGINLIIATFVMLVNLSVDVTYSFLDPRVQYR
jgi:peptide/nickel transport system permease protein